MLQRAIMLAALSSLTHHLFADTEQVRVYFDRQDLSTIQKPGCGATTKDLLSVDNVFKQPLIKRLAYLKNYQECIPQWYGSNKKDMQKLPTVKGWSLTHDPIKQTSTYTHNTHSKDDKTSDDIINMLTIFQLQNNGPEDDSSETMTKWSNDLNQRLSKNSITFDDIPQSMILWRHYNADQASSSNNTSANVSQFDKPRVCPGISKEQHDQYNKPNTIYPVQLANIYEFPENKGKGNVIGIITPYSYDEALYNEWWPLKNFLNQQYSDPIKEPSILTHKLYDAPFDHSYARGESDMDLAIIAAIAPEAEIVMIGNESNDSMHDIFEEAIYYGRNGQNNQKPVNIISSSWYDGDYYSDYNPQKSLKFNHLMEDAALRGITIVSASGDRGTNGNTKDGHFGHFPDCTAPYQLSVGGTSFSPKLASAIQSNQPLDQLKTIFKKEHNEVWNQNWCFFDQDGTVEDSTSFDYNQSSSGGITKHNKPFYQNHINQGYHRIFPDISYLAGGSVDYRLPTTGGGGGTSASAPLTAALVARINTALFHEDTQNPTLSDLRKQSDHSIGFINPLIYQAFEHDKSIFVDTVKGHNCQLIDDNTGKTTCFDWSKPPHQATEGFDLATGFGEMLGKPFLKYIETIALSSSSDNTANQPNKKEQ